MLKNGYCFRQLIKLKFFYIFIDPILKSPMKANPGFVFMTSPFKVESSISVFLLFISYFHMCMEVGKRTGVSESKECTLLILKLQFFCWLHFSQSKHFFVPSRGVLYM